MLHTSVANCRKLEAEFRGALSGLNQEDKRKSCAAFSYRLTRHWNQWLTEFEKAIAADPEEDVYDLINEAKEDALETLADVRRELGTTEAPKPPELKTRPKVMIIDNQNVNGDDLASRLSETHQQAVGFKPLIIRATNLGVERDALIQTFRSPRDDDVREVPGMAEFLQPGIDNDTIADFADDKGEFNKRKFGGIYKLEILLRAMLRAGHRPALKRELEKLGDPNRHLTREEMNALKATVKLFMQAVFSRAHAVICTFVVAQALVNRDYFRPVAVLVDESSREHESLIRYVQLGIDPLFIILTGDHRQDKPHASSINVNAKDKNAVLASHFNVFLEQYLVPLPQRMVNQVPGHVAFLSENFRQRGGL